MSTSVPKAAHKTGGVRELSRRPTRADRDPARTQRRWKATKFILGAGFPIAFFGLWQLASSVGWLDSAIYPSPSAVAATLVELAQDGTLWDETLVSLRRIALGYLLGATAGVVIGFLMGLSRYARATLEPFSWAWYTVPKLALLPVFLTIFGFGELAVVMLLAVTVYFFVWISVMAAVTSVPTGYRDAVVTLDANRWQVFQHVIFPAVLPDIFVGLRLAAGVSVLMLVGVEFVLGGAGLGFLIEQGRTLLLLDQTYAGIIFVSIVGYLFAQLVKWVGNLVTPWAKNDDTATVQ